DLAGRNPRDRSRRYGRTPRAGACRRTGAGVRPSPFGRSGADRRAAAPGTRGGDLEGRIPSAERVSERGGFAPADARDHRSPGGAEPGFARNQGAYQARIRLFRASVIDGSSPLRAIICSSNDERSPCKTDVNHDPWLSATGSLDVVTGLTRPGKMRLTPFVIV